MFYQVIVVISKYNEFLGTVDIVFSNIFTFQFKDFQFFYRNSLDCNLNEDDLHDFLTATQPSCLSLFGVPSADRFLWMSSVMKLEELHLDGMSGFSDDNLSEARYTTLKVGPCHVSENVVLLSLRFPEFNKETCDLGIYSISCSVGSERA
uniref:FBD domain-containing protein n=1 Tax=Heterorhabditis bacteriophora TaxID=37862 RepID=A0A1I7WGK5_HETBA